MSKLSTIILCLLAFASAFYWPRFFKSTRLAQLEKMWEWAFYASHNTPQSSPRLILSKVYSWAVGLPILFIAVWLSKSFPLGFLLIVALLFARFMAQGPQQHNLELTQRWVQANGIGKTTHSPSVKKHLVRLAAQSSQAEPTRTLDHNNQIILIAALSTWLFPDEALQVALFSFASAIGVYSLLFENPYFQGVPKYRLFVSACLLIAMPCVFHIAWAVELGWKALFTWTIFSSLWFGFSSIHQAPLRPVNSSVSLAKMSVNVNYFLLIYGLKPGQWAQALAKLLLLRKDYVRNFTENWQPWGFRLDVVLTALLLFFSSPNS